MLKIQWRSFLTILVVFGGLDWLILWSLSLVHRLQTRGQWHVVCMAVLHSLIFFQYKVGSTSVGGNDHLPGHSLSKSTALRSFWRSSWSRHLCNVMRPVLQATLKSFTNQVSHRCVRVLKALKRRIVSVRLNTLKPQGEPFLRDPARKQKQFYRLLRSVEGALRVVRSRMRSRSLEQGAQRLASGEKSRC